ncbi:MAG TPA: DUF4349 domain-containing protein, partial [Anaerolineae bacterium]
MNRLLALIGILAVALSACAPRALRVAAPTAAPAATVAPAMPPMQQPAFSGSGGAGPMQSLTDANKSVGAMPELSVPQAPAQPAPTAAAGDTGRLVIQTAQLSIVVADVNARVKAIEDMASAMGGFIVSVNVYETYASDGETVPQAQVVVRVPQDKLGDALTQIKKGTVDVQNEQRAGTDVTDQYVDLQSRLKAKQAAADQLMTIMQSATKTQDVLDVYSQLQQIQSDIEVLKGQIKYTEQAAALSAISVNVIAEKTVKPIEVAGWMPQGVARDAIQQLIYFWQAFVDFLIRFFLFILPVL